MKIILFILIFFEVILAQDNICFYSNESYIKNFKTLKVDFYNYLRQYNNYEFQPFNKIEVFEDFLSKNNAISILSSSHYNQIKDKYNLEPLLVAIKNGNTTDTKVLVGKKDKVLSGIVTTTQTKEEAIKSLNEITSTKNFDILSVSKEIDALMSVGFGMSDFAYVSKDSFELLKKVNNYLANRLSIYKESKPFYRLIVAKNYNFETNKLIELFVKMNQKEEGKVILNTFGIEGFEVLNKNEINNLNLRGDTK